MTHRPAFFARAVALVAAVLWASAASAQPMPCTDGFAGAYACDGMDLYAHVSVADFGSGSGNDVWGWTDPETGREYALTGLNDGTGIVDVTDPGRVVNLGKIPTATEPSVWRDIKVYRDHAFIVSEAPGHGMQVFDLTRLRGLTADPTRLLEPDVTFTGPAETPLGNVHNIAINEESGFAYPIGQQECAGGLYMVDIRDPMNPAFVGCFAEDGYTHDAQCVSYRGPDQDYQGREICVGSNEDTITIVDVTDKANPVQLSKGEYPTPAYTHQGWFTEDQRYFLVDDELDEIQGFSERTRTMVFDLEDLDAPELLEIYNAPVGSADHNMYVLGDRVYQANYASGLRVLDISGIAEGDLAEVASFDIYPETDAAQFNGAWSVYPYFESGTIVVNGIEGGLFVLRPSATTALALGSFDAEANDDGAALVTWTPSTSAGEPFTLQGRRDGEPFMALTTMEPGASRPYRYLAEGLSPGRHDFRLVQLGADGAIQVSAPTSVEIAAPDNYRLSQVFAHPETGTDHVALTVAQPQQVRIELMDAEGRHLKTIRDAQVEANTATTVEVSGPGLPAGTYTVRISGETFEDEREISRTP